MMTSNSKFTALGNSNLEVTRLGLGCMGMSEFYGKIDNKESLKTIQKAYELGINHFDTADCYGFGHNELLLGKAIRDFEREKIVIASKCGIERKQDDPNFIAINNTPEYIKKCCNASLKRLNVDYIDLFYLHRFNPDIPIETSMQALSELVQAGKIRSIGLSEVSAKTIVKAHKIHPIAAIQSEYSIWSREPEKEVIPLCKSLNIGFVAFSPIGRGFFSGKINSIDELDKDDARRFFPRFAGANLANNLFMVNVIKEIAKNKNCTPVQIALAWILAQGNNIVAIPGTKRTSYLEENINTVNISLSKEDLAQLGNNIPFNSASGARMPESFAKFSET